MNQVHELGELFELVQNGNILEDGKTFPDCVPKKDLEEINESYNKLKGTAGFNLKAFVTEHFVLPRNPPVFKSDLRSVEEHIEHLWDILSRKPGKEGGSLINLPFPYVVPGGRFREIYYWDSYFTMLGLRLSGRFDLIQNMVDNFAWLIDHVGYIPNGNRSYYLGRSQPPFFSLMIRLLAERKGPGTWQKYLPQLEKEYNFWMKGADSPPTDHAVHRTVKMKDGSILNRYWDENDTPRPESFREDVELAKEHPDPASLYRHLRAAAESGWDFSTRWFKDPNQFSSIHTTDIIPVDLNCLIYHLETSLAEGFRSAGNHAKAAFYTGESVKRKNAIRKFCWDQEQHFFFDFDFVEHKTTPCFSLAATFPLFFEIATPDQAAAVEDHLWEKFLKAGGLTTTLVQSGQQWDAPNGWAPLQWIAWQGLMNYGFEELADEVKSRWLALNARVFRETGKMTEKYNVWNEKGEGGGGEYPNQDGFGWTNGVFLALSKVR